MIMRMLCTTAAIALMSSFAGGAIAAEMKTDAGSQQAGQPEQVQSEQQAAHSQAPQEPEQQQASGQQPLMGPVDRNDDGRISAEEAQQHRQQTFSALDRDGDGSVSADEMSGVVTVQPGYVVLTRAVPVTVVASGGGLDEDMFGQIDENQDQQISRQEYMSFGERSFQQAYDQSGGDISPADYEQQTGLLRSGVVPIDRDRNGVVEQDEAAQDWARTFSMLDRSADEMVTKQEWSGINEEVHRLTERFAELDKNQDGRISQDEYMDAGKQLMEFADVNADDQVSAWEYRTIQTN